jgi:hypothetical protein
MVRSVVLLLFILHAPVCLGAQTLPGLGADAEVGAAIEVRAGATWVGQHTIPTLALGGLLRLSPHVEVGAEALISLRRARLHRDGSPGSEELAIGQAGAVLRWRPAGDLGGFRWAGSIALGAGNARIQSSMVNETLTSENFIVFEPRVHLLARQDSQVRLSLDGGYRMTAGAAPLPGLPATALRGPTLSATIQVVRDP